MIESCLESNSFTQIEDEAITAVSTVIGTADLASLCCSVCFWVSVAYKGRCFIQEGGHPSLCWSGVMDLRTIRRLLLLSIDALESSQEQRYQSKSIYNGMTFLGVLKGKAYTITTEHAC